MKGTIKFKYDQDNDIIIATPRWNIETSEDVKTWFRQYEVYMKQFNRKMDFIVVLDTFKIGPQIGVEWGEARAKVHQMFARFTYFVHSNNRVRLFVNTSGVRYNVPTKGEVATIEDAIEGVKVARREAKLG